MTRRERSIILGAVLAAIETETLRSPTPRLTNIAMRANLPYDRLVSYLEELETVGMVTDARSPQLAQKGREFLKHYRQWRELVNRFGLGEGEAARREATADPLTSAARERQEKTG